MLELCAILAEIRSRPSERLALATVVATEGHAYRRAGARMLVNADGPLTGTISGGCLEAEVTARASVSLHTGTPSLHHYDLRGDLDLIWGSGSGCEGEAWILVEPLAGPPPWMLQAEEVLAARRKGRMALVFDPGHPRFGQHQVVEGSEPLEGLPARTLVEPVLPPIALWVFGAGVEAQPLFLQARALGWSFGLSDHRPARLMADAYPGADLRCGSPRKVIPGLPLDDRTACLLLTHAFQKDLEALEALLPSPVAYLGLMGHRDRGRRLREALVERGIPAPRAHWERVHTPVGLDLGGHTPEAIALAITAEIHAHFHGGTGVPLREGRGALAGKVP